MNGERKRFAIGKWLILIVLVAVLGGLVFRMMDLRVVERRPSGTTRDEIVLDFSERGQTALLEDDFPADAEVRNLILLIGDGLGFSQILAARAAAEGVKGRLFFERFPVTGWMTTFAVSSMYTDSGAAATALATGRKVEIGALSVDPEGRPLETFAEAARDRGMAIGLLTSSYLLDATPAAFVVHSPTRRDLAEIGRQMAASGATVLAGDTSKIFEGEESAGLLAAFSRNGYRLARGWEEMRSPDIGPREPVLGLFDPGQIADPGRAPRLADLTRLALGRLAADPDGFFLMVEDEESDSGSHHQDFRRVATGVEALAAAAREAVDFARRDGRTLVVLTSDHDTGGLDIVSGRDGEPIGLVWSTNSHTASPVPVFAYGPGARRFGGVRDNTEFAGIVADLLGLDFPFAEAP